MESDLEKIIYHDFGQKKLNEEVDDFDVAAKKILPVDFGRADAATRDTSFASLFPKFEKIQSLRATSTSIRTNKELVDSYALDEVVGWLTRATDREISAKPGFYMALMEKYLELMRL